MSVLLLTIMWAFVAVSVVSSWAQAIRMPAKLRTPYIGLAISGTVGLAVGMVFIILIVLSV